MKNNRILIISLFLISIYWIGCKDDDCDDETNPECSNFNPCLDSKPANADFGIYEFFNSSEFGLILNETDTVVNAWQNVMFRPKHKNDKVTWYIGSEILEEQQVIRRNFPPYENISITMIAEKNPNDCLKSSELRDTVTKKFYAIDRGDITNAEYAIRSPFWGTWEGYNSDSPNDKFIVTIGHINENHHQGPSVSFAMAGLPKGLPLQNSFSEPNNVIPFFRPNLIGYHLMYGKGPVFTFTAIARIINDDLIIDYSYNETPYLQYILGESQQEYFPVKMVKKTFIGTKISNEVRTQ